jgi:predicted DNA-binding transcriptional regulator AlpA
MVTTASPKIPEVAFFKIWQIIGNPKAVPPIPALLPVGRTTFLNRVRDGSYPQPVKLGPRSVAWRVQDIRDLINSINQA